jgi:hypothetical protein
MSDSAQNFPVGQSRLLSGTQTIALITVLLMAGVIYALRLDHVAGEFVDDAWYLLLAKSLATGYGYTLINSPSPGIVPIYPPAYPFFVSLLWRIAPEFPSNVWLLKSVSLAAMLFLGIAAYGYFSRNRQFPTAIAAASTLATLLIPAFVFTATSTFMSECLFALTQLLTIILMERCVHEMNPRLRYLFLSLGAMCAAVSFLTRAMAVAMIGGVVLYLLWKSSFRLALSFALLMAVLILPWMLYSRSNAPTPEQQNEQKSYVVYDYKDHFWRKQAGESGARKISVNELPARVWENFKNIFCRDTGGMLFPAFFRTPEESGMELIGLGYCGGEASDIGLAKQTMMISSIISLIMLIGYITSVRNGVTLAEIAVPCSLLLILLWPWWSFRFVLPLAPFLIAYLVAGIRTISDFLSPLHVTFQQNDSWKFARLTLAVVIALQLYDHAGYLLGSYGIGSFQPPQWTENYREITSTTDFLQSLSETDATIATDNPALVHLLTDRETIACDKAEESRAIWERLNVRYLVRLMPFTDPPSPEQPERKLLYESPRRKLKVIDTGISALPARAAARLSK